jgi:hypothetical protein
MTVFASGGSIMIKNCTKCKVDFPADTDHFYRNKGGKFGLTPRCKKCVNEDNVISHEKRMSENPEKIKRLASERTKRYYQRNLDFCRAKNRERAKKAWADPVRGEALKFYKRAKGAGLTKEQWNDMFEKQGFACAICRSTEPNHPHGWNTDHCHKTKIVRFILCAHCNRGLGAFRDNPTFLRAAAAALEKHQQQHQPNEPVGARYE